MNYNKNIILVNQMLTTKVDFKFIMFNNISGFIKWIVGDIIVINDNLESDYHFIKFN